MFLLGISASGSVSSLGLGLPGESLRLGLELSGCGPVIGGRRGGGRPLGLQLSQGGLRLSQLSVEVGPEDEEDG